VKAIDQGVVSLLTADSGGGGVATLATGGVWARVVPQGTVAPYVVFNQQASTDNYTLRVRAWTEYVYQITAVCEGESGLPAQTINDRIDVVMTDGSLAVPGFTAMIVRRIQMIEYPEIVDGVTITRSGALYRIGVR
jgi:hypothetical protein